jgi:BlaI family penicillinase repressor
MSCRTPSATVCRMSEAYSGLAAHFGPLELGILRVLWRDGEVDVAECVRALGDDSSYSTVKTVMERLVRKGYLARRKQSRLYVYWATRTRAEVEEEVSASQVKQLMDGFGDLAVSHFVRSVQSDSARLEQVRAMLAAVSDDDPERGR